MFIIPPEHTKEKNEIMLKILKREEYLPSILA